MVRLKFIIFSSYLILLQLTSIIYEITQWQNSHFESILFELCDIVLSFL